MFVNLLTKVTKILKKIISKLWPRSTYYKTTFAQLWELYYVDNEIKPNLTAGPCIKCIARRTKITFYVVLNIHFVTF